MTLRLRPRILAEYPHSPRVFTQGLALGEGVLFESAGQYGESALLEVALETGSALRRSPLPPALFGEGLARVGNRITQLTWLEERALVWNLKTFALEAEHPFDGEGWGLCAMGEQLVMSNGSSTLTFRDANTFAPLRTLEVTLDGQPVVGLNDLEVAHGALFANVWPTDFLLRIDSSSGEVNAVIDCTELRARNGKTRIRQDVLNGICFDPASERFFLTGKYWPKLYAMEIDG